MNPRILHWGKICRPGPKISTRRVRWCCKPQAIRRIVLVKVWGLGGDWGQRLQGFHSREHRCRWLPIVDGFHFVLDRYQGSCSYALFLCTKTSL